MTMTQLASMISGIKLPWRYSHFSETPDPPYIVYYFPNDNDVFADNSNYANKKQLFIELFTETENELETEALIESALKSAGLSWYKQTDFLNDEKLFQTVYEMEVVINGE